MAADRLDQSNDTVQTKGGRAGGRLIVGIATIGRADVLDHTVRHIATQTRLPDCVILSVCDPSDVGALAEADLPFPIKVLISAPGLCKQRNRILAELTPDDVLLFLDDDFLMAPDYLAELERLMQARPDIVKLTGAVLADGIIGPGLSVEDGLAALANGRAEPAGAGLRDVLNGYGCNMAVRARPIVEAGLRFDEHLPKYAWLEDVDFGGQMRAHGRVMRAEALRGVHLGIKRARMPGQSLGYSQIANPVYLMRKGTVSWRRGLRIMLRNVSANLVRQVRPEPWTDHRGRLFGNLRAVGHLLTGRIDPERVA